MQRSARLAARSFLAPLHSPGCPEAAPASPALNQAPGLRGRGGGCNKCVCEGDSDERALRSTQQAGGTMRVHTSWEGRLTQQASPSRPTPSSSPSLPCHPPSFGAAASSSPPPRLSSPSAPSSRPSSRALRHPKRVSTCILTRLGQEWARAGHADRRGTKGLPTGAGYPPTIWTSTASSPSSSLPSSVLLNTSTEPHLPSPSGPAVPSPCCCLSHRSSSWRPGCAPPSIQTVLH